MIVFVSLHVSHAVGFCAGDVGEVNAGTALFPQPFSLLF